MIEMQQETTQILRMLMEEIENLKREIARLKGAEERPVLMDFDIYALAEFFGVLSSPERLQILKLLYEKDRYFSELENLLRLSPSSMRHHLSKLMKIGAVVQERSRGKYVISELGRRLVVFLGEVYNRFLRG